MGSEAFRSLLSEGSDNTDSGQVFLNCRGKRAFRFVGVREILLNKTEIDKTQNGKDGERDHGDQRHLHVNRQHKDHCAEEHDHSPDDFHHLV